MKTLNKDTITPMMKQYLEIKENTNDALVFYRLGDFYELFFEDAVIASKVLDLVLTARSAGGDQKAAMAGVPHHAAQGYIEKLIEAGYKVAIVEQTEDPKLVKGLVKRDVVEIITPGTYFENDDNETREVASIHRDQMYATIVSCNVMSGAIRAIRLNNDWIEIIKVLEQFQVKECVLFEASAEDPFVQYVKDKTNIHMSYEKGHVQTQETDEGVQIALGRLLAYLQNTSKRELSHLGDVVFLNDESYMKMDYSAMTNLELLDHQRSKELSLYNFLNRTKTRAGARTLKELVMQPLIDIQAIHKRHTMIDALMHDFMTAQALNDLLDETYDVHRIVARVATNKQGPQDLVRLKKTLGCFQEIQKLLQTVPGFEWVQSVDPMVSVYETLDRVIRDDAPALLKEGRIFHEGVDADLDDLMALSKDGRSWLLSYEQTQREVTGIKNLKVGYNRAFGYYIEISKGQVGLVKDDFGFIRKQTLTNAERYISEALQEYEVKIHEAHDRIAAIEARLFETYSRYVFDVQKQVHDVGNALAMIDAMGALAHVSQTPGYTKPIFVTDGSMTLLDGRHPVLEATLTQHQYIASDWTMNHETRQTLMLTGPNMGGKSTYMRMVALNVILAQMGCYVPATEAKLSIVDQIFTRMGASDDILLGQSTFMVEMMEAQDALSKATSQSLVLFDEIGRGTSTYDGMALAQAIVEHMTLSVKAKTIFSTHYHELVQLATHYPNVKNVHVEVHEENDHVTFLYRVIDGNAPRSYGINVARLAHLPKTVLDNATKNLVRLEQSQKEHNLKSDVVTVEVTSQAYEQVKSRLSQLDISRCTPMEAMILLSEIQEMMKHESN